MIDENKLTSTLETEREGRNDVGIFGEMVSQNDLVDDAIRSDVEPLQLTDLANRNKNGVIDLAGSKHVAH